jgi:hypothetical protein
MKAVEFERVQRLSPFLGRRSGFAAKCAKMQVLARSIAPAFGEITGRQRVFAAHPSASLHDLVRSNFVPLGLDGLEPPQPESDIADHRESANRENLSMPNEPGTTNPSATD